MKYVAFDLPGASSLFFSQRIRDITLFTCTVKLTLKIHIQIILMLGTSFGINKTPEIFVDETMCHQNIK